MRRHRLDGSGAVGNIRNALAVPFFQSCDAFFQCICNFCRMDDAIFSKCPRVHCRLRCTEPERSVLRQRSSAEFRILIFAGRLAHRLLFDRTKPCDRSACISCICWRIAAIALAASGLAAGRRHATAPVQAVRGLSRRLRRPSPRLWPVLVPRWSFPIRLWRSATFFLFRSIPVRAVCVLPEAAPWYFSIPAGLAPWL